MKTCTKCKQSKQLSEFGKDKTRNDGHFPNCKACTKEFRKHFYAKNKKRILDKQKQHRADNPKLYKDIAKREYDKNRDKILERNKKYNAENCEAISEQRKMYRDKNRDKIRLEKAIYYFENKEEISKKNKIYKQNRVLSENSLELRRINARKRRAIRVSVDDGTITNTTLKELRLLQDNKCYKCKCELDFKSKNKVHLDHHLPLSKGGTHTIGNVVYLCKHCNLSKSAKIPTTLLLV